MHLLSTYMEKSYCCIITVSPAHVTWYTLHTVRMTLRRWLLIQHAYELHLLLLLLLMLRVVVAGLTEVLTLSACLLSLVQWPTAMSAPTSTGGIPANHPRLWVNPCGFPQQASEEANDQISLEQVSVEQMLDAIIIQVKNAIASVDQFKIRYVSTSVFNNHSIRFHRDLSYRVFKLYQADQKVTCLQQKTVVHISGNRGSPYIKRGAGN